MNPLTIAKYAAIALAGLLVLGGAWMLRDELIAKGENIIKAQDNAALVKAQQQQTKDDAERLKGQAVYIEHLESQGTQIKEKIRYVQAPCANDGRGDARLDDAASWVRGQLAPGGIPAAGGPQPKAAVPTASAAPTSGSSPVR